MHQYFITGGAGFIGSHTVDQLVAAGERVTVFDKKTWQEATNLRHLDESITYIEGDIRDFNTLRQAMRGHTHVLHLAARVSVPESIEDPVGTHDTNVTGTLMVLEAARQCCVARLVFASSSAVYGNQEQLPIHEDVVREPLSPYGLHKQMNEEYASLYRRIFGLSSLGLRYFNVFGRRQDASSPYSGVISIFAKRMRSGEPITLYGAGAATRDFIPVETVAQINIHALRSTYDGVMNVGLGVEYSVRAIFDMCAEITGYQHDPVIAETREGDIPRSVAATERLKSALGFEPSQTLRSGLESLLRA